MKVIFFGTPQFAANVLDYLCTHEVEIAAIVTKPDKPKGRSGALIPTPVKAMASARLPSVPVFQPELVSSPDFANVLPSFQADLFVVVAYGEIIKQHLLDMPRLGCINLHTSLLPKYRGAAPIQRCLMEGESESGVTIIHMAKKMDAGDIIKRVEVPIGRDTTFGELENQLCSLGSKAMLDVVHAFEDGIIQRTPQDHSMATFAPKIELEDCEIDWHRSAQEIHNLVRGVNPYPGAWCRVSVRGKPLRLKISRTELVVDPQGKPGEIVNYGPSGLIVSCSAGAVCLLDVQLEGKKAMSAEEMMRGIPQTEFSIEKV
jgi:methionyl-tRNA formyltransferase